MVLNKTIFLNVTGTNAPPFDYTGLIILLIVLFIFIGPFIIGFVFYIIYLILRFIILLIIALDDCYNFLLRHKKEVKQCAIIVFSPANEKIVSLHEIIINR